MVVSEGDYEQHFEVIRLWCTMHDRIFVATLENVMEQTPAIVFKQSIDQYQPSRATHHPFQPRAARRFFLVSLSEF